MKRIAWVVKCCAGPFAALVVSGTVGAQVSTDCVDCTAIRKRPICAGGQFDDCANSPIGVGGSCLAVCALECETIIARICDQPTIPGEFRRATTCAELGSMQMFVLCRRSSPVYDCECDFFDVNNVFLYYPCSLATPDFVIRPCAS
jgi:hypothetical protein